MQVSFAKHFSTAAKPLQGVRVLEMGQLIAGPYTGTILGYYGAEVIKVEAPNGMGDPIRVWRELDNEGTSHWWKSIGRNKKSVTLDLKSEEGRSLARRLSGKCDVLVENFRPGVMESWGLDPETLRDDNPGLIVARISGYGQDGPYAARPGYASVCEAMGGLRHINGFPGLPPVRPNISLGDSLAGVHAALGVLLALQARHTTGKGQVVDVAIYEAMFSMMEGIFDEFDRAGKIRGPSGSTVTGIVPTNTYLCADEKWIVIGGNGDSIFQRLMKTANRDDLAHRENLSTNAGRVEHQQEVDDAIAEWTKTLPLARICELLEEAGVPAGPIYDVSDMESDPHFNARGMFEQSAGVRVPAMCPRLTDTPGGTEWAGEGLGNHTDSVLSSLLGLGGPEIAQLRDDGVI